MRFFKREKRAANYLPASRGTYCEELSLRKRRVQPCFVLITRLLLLTASTPASNLKAHYIKRGVTQRQKGKRLFQSLHSSDRNYEEESI